MAEPPAQPAPPDSSSPLWIWIVASDSISGTLCFFEVPAGFNPSGAVPFRRACAMTATREGPALKKWNVYGMAADAKAQGTIRLGWWLPAHADAVQNCRQLWGEISVIPVRGDASASKILHLPK